MKRYVRMKPAPKKMRQVRDYEDYDDDIPDWKANASIVVHEEGEMFEPTGILDPDGNNIMRQVKYPIGFVWHDENGELRPRHHFVGGPDDGDDTD